MSNNQSSQSAAVTDVTFHSTHRKEYQSKLSVVHSRVYDVISKACFTVVTGDRHDELPTIDLSMIAVALTSS